MTHFDWYSALKAVDWSSRRHSNTAYHIVCLFPLSGTFFFSYLDNLTFIYICFDTWTWEVTWRANESEPYTIIYLCQMFLRQMPLYSRTHHQTKSSKTHTHTFYLLLTYCLLYIPRIQHFLLFCSITVFLRKSRGFGRVNTSVLSVFESTFTNVLKVDNKKKEMRTEPAQEINVLMQADIHLNWQQSGMGSKSKVIIFKSLDLINSWEFYFNLTATKGICRHHYFNSSYIRTYFE